MKRADRDAVDGGYFQGSQGLPAHESVLEGVVGRPQLRAEHPERPPPRVHVGGCLILGITAVDHNLPIR